MTDINNVLAERKKTHGDYKDHARVTQDLLAIAMDTPNWNTLCPEYREGIHMILHKLGRIVTGTPYYIDHVADIQGYAKLMQNYAERCEHA